MSRVPSSRRWRLFVVISLVASLTGAHEAIDHQIELLDGRIAAEPDCAESYLSRAELHRADGEWDKALNDYARALDLDPGLTRVYLGRGRVLRASSRLFEAIANLEHYTAHDPHSAEGLIQLARSHASLDHPQQAVHLFDRAFARMRQIGTQPDPGDIISRARCVVAMGPEHIDEALAGLDQALAWLGPIATVTLEAYSIEERTGRYHQALSRLDELEGRSVRREGCHYRRGSILERMGRTREAEHAYQLAQCAIAAVPPARRGSQDMANLEQDIEAALCRVELDAYGSDPPPRSAP